MNLLRKFLDKNLITIETKNNKIYLTRNNETKEFIDFTRFMAELHSIDGSLNQYQQKKGMFNPIAEELNHADNLVAKGDKVWVFKGSKPNICRILGKNQTWCISSSTSAAHWFSYRMNYGQTQYFVFDFNKDESDPARYVNPGVAPEAGYSEWVDASNSHTTDPEDHNSQVGINGYKSINEYKKYLASKGIPESIWTTTKPEDWEKRLQHYINSVNFSGAKTDVHPEVFPIYLKVVDNINDSDFDKLSDDQKREFVLGKIAGLSKKQFKFAKDVSGYYNSLDSDGKIIFAAKTNDKDLLLPLLKNPELSEDNVRLLIMHTNNTDEMAKFIITHKPELSFSNVEKIVTAVHNLGEIAKFIILHKKELSNDNVYLLFAFANDKDEIASILGSENINKLSSNHVYQLITFGKHKDKTKRPLKKYYTGTDPKIISLLEQ